MKMNKNMIIGLSVVAVAVGGYFAWKKWGKKANFTTMNPNQIRENISKLGTASQSAEQSASKSTQTADVVLPGNEDIARNAASGWKH